MSVSRFFRSLFGSPELPADIEHDVRDATQRGPFAPDAHDPGRLASAISDDAMRVYGDWLSEQGDPRGELIALTLAGDMESARSLRQRHLLHFYGPLAQMTVKAVDTSEQLRGLDLYGPEGVRVLWGPGYLDGVAVALERERGPMSDVLQALRHPSCARLRTLVLHGAQLEGIGPEVAALGPFPTVRELVIGDFDSEECEVSWAQQGAWPGLAGAFPGLRRLELLQVFELGRIPAGLVELDLRVAGEEVAHSVNVDWGPEGTLSGLQKAVLQGGDTVDWLARPDLGSLTELAVGHEDARAVAEALGSRPGLAGQLERLSLSGCDLAGAEGALIELEPLLVALEKLTIPEDGDFEDDGLMAAYGDRLVSDARSEHYYEALWE